MQPILIKQQYKVIQVLCAEEDFAAFLAVDIESREKKEYLLNVYEDARIKQYISAFSELKHCPQFVEMFAGEGMLAVVFTYRAGTCIDDVFYKGAEVDWRTRMHYAQLLFHLGLSVYNFPCEIGCAALLSCNLVLRMNEKTLETNYLVRPMDGMNERELTFLVCDQIKKVLLKRYSSPNAELSLLQTLEAGRFKNAKELYAYWVRVKDTIYAEYEKIEAKPAVGRALYLLFLNLGRWFKRVILKKGVA